jgi:hypothetical protein
MALDKQQVKRLEDKLHSIMSEKLRKIDRKYLSSKEKYNLIKKGKVKLKPLSEIDVFDNMQNFFDFNAYENHKLYEDTRKKLQAEKDRILDVAIFGEAGEVLAMIEAFTKFKV